MRFAVAPPHDVFLVGDDVAPDCDLVVAFGDATPMAGPARFSAGGQWELRTHEGGGDEICFFGRIDGPESEPITRLRLDRALRSGTVSTRLRAGDGDTFVIGYPLDEYVAGRLLGRAGGVVLHATAILDGDEAIVFAGHSGAGKSTIAKIAEDCGGRVLSDDRTIIRVDDAGRARAYGTPWHGSLKRGDPSGAEVRAVYLLSQARYDAVEELSSAAALAEIYVRLIQPSVDSTEAANAIDTVGRLVSRTRIARLHFRPTASAYEVARSDRGVPVAARDGTA
ncbi:MAG TPA: hypothetical protein VFJ78_04985 [Gaiellaceae bacterium]|nr:hypothetical protein [Gaiellaceae bacterium]